MGKRWSFQTNSAGQLKIHMQKKINLGTDITPFTKINSKWITSLNVKCKIMKLLENKMGEILDALGYGNDLLDATKNL